VKAVISSPNKVIIDLSALVRNLHQIRALVSEDTRIMGVVKADAYGHGLLRKTGLIVSGQHISTRRLISGRGGSGCLL